MNDLARGPGTGGTTRPSEAVRVILVETSHPGNIGATARAMKTMGLTRLVLVAPRTPVDETAWAMASGASDILDERMTVDDLESAIADCHWVIATSARARQLQWPEHTPREAAQETARRAAQGERIGWVFGPERTGLTNADLARCQRLVRIPANPEYPSLNLAASVQILAYERRCAMPASPEPAMPPAEDADPPATAAEVAGLIEHAERVLIQIEFLDPTHPGHLMRRLWRLCHRIEPSRNEVRILRGLLSAIDRSRPRKPE